MFELPAIPLRVRKHRAERRRCGCGELTRVPFPEGVAAPTPYGRGFAPSRSTSSPTSAFPTSAPLACSPPTDSPRRFRLERYFIHANTDRVHAGGLSRGRTPAHTVPRCRGKGLVQSNRCVTRHSLPSFLKVTQPRSRPPRCFRNTLARLPSTLTALTRAACNSNAIPDMKVTQPVGVIALRRVGVNNEQALSSSPDAAASASSKVAVLGLLPWADLEPSGAPRWCDSSGGGDSVSADGMVFALFCGLLSSDPPHPPTHSETKRTKASRRIVAHLHGVVSSARPRRASGVLDGGCPVDRHCRRYPLVSKLEMVNYRNLVWGPPYGYGRMECSFRGP